ncbi:MAG TPA: FAD-binding protein [Terriglobales bacterium]|nr:FAD-binding protein [Terriglobales bacterium]
MTGGRVRIGGVPFPLRSVNTLVIGSGAAGLNAAVRLHAEGQPDVAVLTDRFGGGASRNSGSDKQTYYKLSVAGDRPDSPFEMARDLAAGGSTHGDIALCEAVGSAEAFFRLVALGVPFPQDEHGAFVGYRTDNDPRQRATSAGPLTSRLMFEALAGEVRRRRIPVLDGHRAIALLTAGRAPRKRAVGAIALDKRNAAGRNLGFVLFNAVNVVLATGGPGGMYEHSVYPAGQNGAHGLALAAGAVAHNLTESQYGLASVKFRWNLSGAYQQAIPRYVSTAPDGSDEREFLNDFFPDMRKLAAAVFLKGYEWPFDPARAVDGGSSLIDILVHEETVIRGRRVFLDYRRDATGGGKLAPFEIGLVAGETRAYLERSGALLPTPIARLRKMNRPAVELFKRHGIDLGREPLEAAVCAQHSNGGFKAGIWWESNIRHLFPVGEACGTHGVRRPGGAALNAGQVGSARAARFIAAKCHEKPPSPAGFVRLAGPAVRRELEFARSLLGKTAMGADLLREALTEVRRRMSACGGHVRPPADVARETPRAWVLVERLRRELRVPSARALPAAFEVLDMALTHAVFLEAIREYLERGGKSRGSYLVPDPAGRLPCPGLDGRWAFSLAAPADFTSAKILEVGLGGGGRPVKNWVDVRPVPPDASWFETVWDGYLADGNIREEE